MHKSYTAVKPHVQLVMFLSPYRWPSHASSGMASDFGKHLYKDRVLPNAAQGEAGDISLPSYQNDGT